MKPKPLRWVDAVVLAIAKHGGEAHLNRIYDDAPRIYGKRPATFESVVSATLHAHSSDSDAFTSSRDLFTAPHGLGTGIWRLRNLDWTVGDAITPNGQLWLLVAIMMDLPPQRYDGSPLDVLKARHLVDFAQVTLPRLKLWRDAT